MCESWGRAVISSREFNEGILDRNCWRLFISLKYVWDKYSMCHALLMEQHINMFSCVCGHCLSIHPLVKYSSTLCFSEPV